MDDMLENLGRALGRVFPGCVTIGQAVAFNMFLAFFQMLLFALGVMTSVDTFRGEVRELPERLRTILPPGSERMVLDFFMQKGSHPERWIWLGMGGMLLAGSQVLIGFIQGFRVIENTEPRISYGWLQFRAFAMFSMTIVPWIAFVILTVFGRPMRGWLIGHLGLAPWVRLLAAGVYHGLALTIALLVVIVLYRLGQPAMHALSDVLPGAAVATVLWWTVDISFGFYVRLVPYDTIYRGLAAVIGLLLWMYLTAMVLFIGAAYNTIRFEDMQVHPRYRTLT